MDRRRTLLLAASGSGCTSCFVIGVVVVVGVAACSFGFLAFVVGGGLADDFGGVLFREGGALKPMLDVVLLGGGGGGGAITAAAVGATAIDFRRNE